MRLQLERVLRTRVSYHQLVCIVIFLVFSAAFWGCSTKKAPLAPQTSPKDEPTPHVAHADKAEVLGWKVSGKMAINSAVLAIRPDPTKSEPGIEWFGVSAHCGERLLGYGWGARYKKGERPDLSQLRVVLISDEGKAFRNEVGKMPTIKAEIRNGEEGEEIEKLLIFFEKGRGEQGIVTVMYPERHCPFGHEFDNLGLE